LLSINVIVSVAPSGLLRMGFWLFLPTTLPERAQRYTERSPAAIKRTFSIVRGERRPSNRPPSSM
jgi:hypothetical protein